MSAKRHVLVFGTSGQLGRELGRSLAGNLEMQAVSLSRADADFTNPDAAASAVLTAPDLDIVINATAYTAVDRAEQDPETARIVNAISVGRLADACRARNVPLIHVSTDYVYDGTKPIPYVETDAVNPVSVYGQTKMEGENNIRAAWEKHVIVRTSWIYSAHGANFVKTMLRLGAERDELRVVDDQYGAPTSAANLAEALVQIAGQLLRRPAQRPFGVFHYADAGETSWHGFAEEIFRQASWAKAPARLLTISAADYPAAARRPANSRLNTDKLAAVFGINPPPWNQSLAHVLAELKENRA